MIAGLQVTLTQMELQQLCEARAQFHLERAKAHQEQKEHFEANAIHSDPDMAGIESVNYMNAKPAEEMARKVREHTNAANEMAFIAEHLDANETYLLDYAALERLGIVSSRW